MSTRKNLLVIVALLLFGYVDPTHAAPVAVTNFSFEQPSVGESPTSTGTVSQAADTAIPGWGADMPAGLVAGVQAAGNSSDGVQDVYVNGKGDRIYQDVGTLLPNTTYALTATILDGPSAQGLGSLAELSLFNGTDVTGTFLTFATTTTQKLPQELTLTYTSGAIVSGDLTLVLGDSAGIQVDFDNVRLSATPEPSSCVLLGFGAIGLYLIVRRRRARS